MAPAITAQEGAITAQERALAGTSTKAVRQPPKRAGTSTRIPRLSVVIVNYRLWEETAHLVRRLQACPFTQQGDVEIVVIDNHSPLHPQARRLRRAAGVSLRRCGRNRGFARAANEGCRLSRGRWILLLNPDISFSDHFIDGVLKLAERLSTEDPRAGIVGFQLRNSDGSHQLSSGPFPTLAQTVARLALPRTRRKYHFVRAQRPRRVPWVTGCCVLLRRSCLEDLGGLDRDFFLYYEDVDLCQRARARGWSVWYEPRLRAIHHHPLHLRSVPAYLRLLTRHALLTYASKHWSGWQFRVLAGMIELEARFRRHWAQRQGDAPGAELFADLRAIAADLRCGRADRARQRLGHIVHRQELRRAS
jgi:N-acetylglucosaminyl-diphospho-decaprenol L-rhamnosyltransferase